MKKEQIFWGVFFILGAVVLLVSKLGFMGDIDLWTVLLTVFIVAALIKSLRYRSPSGILFSIAFLCILFAEPWGITAITPWTVLGVAMFGSIGCSILFHKTGSRWKYVHSDEDYGMETIEGDCINLNTSFAGSVKYINSKDFKSARLSCSFGNMKVYFDNAVITGGKAMVSIDASFSGMELFIPREWNVENLVDVSFGGIEEKNRNASTHTATLLLTGECSFSGVTIIYV